jgi:hypothetical protein
MSKKAEKLHNLRYPLKIWFAEHRPDKTISLNLGEFKSATPYHLLHGW